MKIVSVPTLRKWAVFCFMLSLQACRGPQGEVGPQGAVGATGAAGPQGPQGPQGTANLIVSAWTSVLAKDWKSDNDPSYFYIELEDKNITQAIIDKGVVMAYYRNPAQKGAVLALPSVTKEVSIGYLYLINQGRGFITFDLSYFQARKVPIDFDIEVRWIIVPPNPGGRQKAIDWGNYEDVKRELDLSD